MDKVKVKMEEDDVPVDAHEHHTFIVKFKNSDPLIIECKQPSTVLEAIKSYLGEEFKKYIKCIDEKLLIQLGNTDTSPFVSTHFPCSCVMEDVCLIITTFTRPVEAKAKNPKRHTILKREGYSIFFINKEGGKNTNSRTNKVFLEMGHFSKLSYFCVYGKKGTTVEEALNRDGRFVDGLTDFKLSNEKQEKTMIKSIQTVNKLHGKKFKICLPMKKRAKAKCGKRKNSTEQLEQQKTASKNPQSSKTKPESEMKKGGKETTNDIIRLAAEEGISLGEAMKEKQSGIDVEVINELLRKQFPDLKQWMESRFPGESFQEELKLKKENFGKIQQSFSEVHRLKGVLELSDSICLLKVSGSVPCSEIEEQKVGTGFVLFDNFVLTNKHLFGTQTEEGTSVWWTNVSVTAQFHFENPYEAGLEFTAEVFGGCDTLDYALVQLSVDDPNTTASLGLLKRFWSTPDDGEACIVGHPAGGVKKLDPICVIKKDQREEAIRQNLARYNFFAICDVDKDFKKEPSADIIVTYNTSMYHGSSGSPVFDGSGRVFGLHSGGFLFNERIPGHSLIEYCYPLLYIFEELVRALKVHGSTKLLLRIQEEAKKNKKLKEILASVLGTSGHDVPTRQNQEEGNEGESQGDTQSDEEMDTSRFPELP
ncbi:serine protease FAM111A-like isoform X2 [Cololabis saira]|nr:serine protease FAM111A-like isoform X2 [Cololabis saira]